MPEAKNSASDQVCEKCGKTRSLGNGSLTQWIVACQCVDSKGLVTPQVSAVTRLCSICGKALSEGRQGSMTQWIFRVDTCKCANPTVIFGTPVGVPAASAFDLHDPKNSVPFGDGGGLFPPVITGGVTLDVEPALEVDPDKFPADRYKAVELIGQGMNGIVFRAHDTLLARTVAIKSVRVLTQLTAEQVLLFQREAKATSQLEHRNLIQVYDFGITSGGVPYLVMEYFRGQTLASFLEKDGALPLVLAAQIMVEICRGMEHAHQRGVLHRDLKSSNILLIPPERDEYWTCKVIDFGLAALPLTDADGHKNPAGAMFGSPPYMSPEQVRGSDIDCRSDIYSLGCIFFEMLTGEVPFIGDNALATMMMHIDEEPPLVSDRKRGLKLAENVDAIVSKALRKKAEERYENVSELKEEIKNLLILIDSHSQALLFEEEGVLAETKSAVVSPNRYLRREGKLVYTLSFCVIGLVLLAVLGFSTYKSRTPPKIEPSMTATMHDDKDLFGLPPVPDEALKTHQYPVSTRTAASSSVTMVDQDNLYLKENRNLYIKGQCVKGGVDADDDSLKLLENPTAYPFVNELVMRGTSFRGPGLRFLRGRPIKYVDLSENQLSLSAVPLLGELPALVRVSINHCALADNSDFSSLKNCKNLLEVSVGDSKVDDRIVQEICAIKSLRTLNISANPGVSDAVVDVLCGLPNLGTLDISDTSISSSGLLRLAARPQLFMLSASTTPLTDAELTKLVDIVKKKHMQALAINCNLTSNDAALKLLDLKSSVDSLDLRSGGDLKGGTRARLQNIWPKCFEQDESLTPSLGRKS